MRSAESRVPSPEFEPGLENPTPFPSPKWEGRRGEASPTQGGGLASRLGLALGYYCFAPFGALVGGDEEWKRMKRQANLQIA